MANRALSWALPLLLLAAASSTAQERVAALPGEGSSSGEVVLLSDAGDTATISLSSGTFKAVASPDGSRIFFLSNSDASSYLTVTDSTGTVLAGAEELFVAASHAHAMVMSPVGGKLLVLAGALYLFDTSGDKLTPLGAAEGSNGAITAAVDVTVSHDGLRAFVVGVDSKLYVVDLTTNRVVDALSLPAIPTSVAVGPNGLVYVGSYQCLMELTGGSGQIPIAVRSVIALTPDTSAGKPIFTPDGHYAILRNTAPNGPTVLVYNIEARTIAELWLQGGTTRFSDIATVSETAFYGIAGGKLFRGDLALGGLDPATFTGVSSLPTTITSIAVSREVPAARKLYIATDLGELLQFDIPSAKFERSFTGNRVLNQIWSERAGTPVAPLRAFNTNQTVEPYGRAIPLVIRAVGQDGLPLSGVPVSWSGMGTIIGMSRTNADGYAQALVDAAGSATTHTVTANAAGLSHKFTIVVSGTGTGDGETGSVAGVHIIRGNGEIAMARRVNPPLLEVEVRDAQGRSIPDAMIAWNVSRADGSIDEGGSMQVVSGDTRCASTAGRLWSQEITCISDSNGRASVLFSGQNTTPHAVQYAVTATSGQHSITFLETVLPMDMQASADIRRPDIGTLLNAPVGVPQTGAIGIAVFETIGSPRPLPDVAVNVSTGLDAQSGPTATCEGGPAMTNRDGIAVCNLVGGGKLGQALLKIDVGGIPAFYVQLRINVVPGPAKTIVIKRGDNQIGSARQELPIPLLAELKDGNGSPVVSAETTFQIVKGSGSLKPATTQSDSNGQVSTVLTLGSQPGDVEVLVKSGLASAVFKATVKGPVVSKASFLNGASFLPGVPLGGIVTVQARGLLTGAPEIPVGQCVSETDDAGKLPTRVANMEFQFAGRLAPIFSVCRMGEDQGQANLQLPWEVPAGPVDLKVRTGMGTETAIEVAVPGIEVLNAMPGVFQWFTEAKTIAVANRVTDGSVVTPSNPARIGEKLRIFATGLGPVVGAKTNEYGAPDQKPVLTPVVVLGGTGAGEVTSAYAEGMLSVFSVEFKVPGTATGDLKLKVGVTTDKGVVEGPEVLLPVAQ